MWVQAIPERMADGATAVDHPVPSPWTHIGNEDLPWQQHVVWGNGVIWGSTTSTARR